MPFQLDTSAAFEYLQTLPASIYSHTETKTLTKPVEQPTCTTASSYTRKTEVNYIKCTLLIAGSNTKEED